MDKILLVARREYFAYVTAWGFWLGLLFTPLILALSAGLPMLIEKTQPARYYTVIEPDTSFSDALRSELSERQERIAIEILDAAPEALGGLAPDDAVEQFEARRAAGDTVEEAFSAVLPGAARSALPSQSFVEVPPPARSLDGLRPYLQGEALVSGQLGERALYGAFIVLEDRIEYWSEDVVSNDLSRTARNVSEDLARQAAFDAAGLDPQIIEIAINNARPVESRSPSVADADGEISFADRAPFFVALALSFMLWLVIFSVVNYLLTGTIEERSNKIFDTILTSVSLPQLMTGKLLGVLGLSLTLIGVWGGASGAFALSASSQIPPEVAQALSQILQPKFLIPFFLSFVLGYLMYGAMFLALGSLCDTIQEAQALLSPIFIMMMLPLLMLPVSIESPDSPLLGIMSWIPLMTPFLLILRIPTDLPLWMTLAQIVWMAGFTALMIWAGTRVYRAGAVHGAGISEAREWAGKLVGLKSKKS